MLLNYLDTKIMSNWKKLNATVVKERRRKKYSAVLILLLIYIFKLFLSLFMLLVVFYDWETWDWNFIICIIQQCTIPLPFNTCLLFCGYLYPL